MTGFRIGYGAGPRHLTDAMRSVQCVTTMCPSSIGQAAAIAAFQGPKNFIDAQRDILRRRLSSASRILDAAPGLKCAMPEGAFYLYVNCEGLMNSGQFQSDREVAAYLLAQAGVAAAPGESFGVSPYFRLSGAAKRLNEACLRINQACCLPGRSLP
jgi:aspartate aminotransferase